MLWISLNRLLFCTFDITCVLNFTSKVISKLSGFFTTGKGVKISSILLDSKRVDSYVPLLTDTVPFLEFWIEFQSNNLTYQPKYTKKQYRIHDLIIRLNCRGLGYRKISQKLNGLGIKTKRNKIWSNSSVYSVIKRKKERDGLTENTRNIVFPMKISEFKIKYYSFE